MPGGCYTAGMMTGQDSSYYNRRAGEERDAAQRATDPRARQSHLEMALRYEAAANSASGIDPAPAARAAPILPPDLNIIP